MNTKAKLLSIVLAQEQPEVRNALKRLLSAQPGIAMIAEADDAADVAELIRSLHPDIVILDLPLARKLQGTLSPVNGSGQARFLATLTAMEEEQLVNAFRMGADGIVFNGASSSALLEAIRSARAGTYWLEGESAVMLVSALREIFRRQTRKALTDYGLTPRELEIVATIASGDSNREVGRKFSISERTVKHHLTNIFNKVGVSSRLELALFAVNHRLGPLPVPQPEPLETRGSATVS